MRPTNRQRRKPVGPMAKRNRRYERHSGDRHRDRTTAQSSSRSTTHPNGQTPPDLRPYLASEKQSMQFADEIYRPARASGVAATYYLNQKAERNPARNFLLETTGTEITRLMDLPYEDRRPDNRAHVLAHQMIIKLVDLRFNVPASDVYSDPDKAIRLLWNRGDRTVELVFPSDETEAPYLYRSDQQDYHAEENPTPESILKWLHWVLGDLSPGGIRAA